MDRSGHIQLRVRRRSRVRGFTLIELMVVAAIVAILLAIVFIAVLGPGVKFPSA